MLINFDAIGNSYSFDEEINSTRKKHVDIMIRFGQGGFSDNRSDINKLGGGQLALTVKTIKFPVALTFSNEYYTNSAEPTNSFEIENMTIFNVMYMDKLLKKERIDVFIGGGTGWLEVPDGLFISRKSMLGNLEAGINIRAFWKIGFYGVYKYLYANRDVIDFNEHIFMLGISFKFSL